jgi:hypothetical protein
MVVDRSPSPRGTGRRRRVLLILLATGLLAAGVVPFVGGGAASAIPPPCPDGSPAPCIDPDPDPDPPSTTTPPTSPPSAAWSARVSVLDQTPAPGFTRSVRGSWGQVGTPYATPSGTIAWSNPPQNEGTLTLAHGVIPAGPPVGLRLFEIGSESGRLCRSMPYGSVPPSGRSVHVLVAPSVVKTPDQLTAMVAGFAGRVQPDPQGAEVTITEAPTIVPIQGGLIVTVKGRIWKDIQFPIPNFDASFTYVVTLHIDPSTNIGDPLEVMTVRADVGVLQIFPDSWDDDILNAFSGNVEPDFRSAVVGKAKTAVNDAVSAQEDVQWFRSLGYTVSARKVNITPNGVEVQPSLCKVD